MRRIWVAALAVACLIVAVAPASGQVGSVAPVTPSKSGMVSYIQGAVYADDTLIPDPIVAQFPYMKEGGTLRTTEGRAEVVMNPGLMMRVGENSTLRMITNRFIDTREINAHCPPGHCGQIRQPDRIGMTDEAVEMQ